MITWKDIILLIVGVGIGFAFGVTIYSTPIRQFCNEWKALWNLITKWYSKDQIIHIRRGTYKQLDGLECEINQEGRKVMVNVDRGIEWYHTSSGWIRARVLYVATIDDSIPPRFLISHRDIIS